MADEMYPTSQGQSRGACVMRLRAVAVRVAAIRWIVEVERLGGLLRRCGAGASGGNASAAARSAEWPAHCCRLVDLPRLVPWEGPHSSCQRLHHGHLASRRANGGVDDGVGRGWVGSGEVAAGAGRHRMTAYCPLVWPLLRLSLPQGLGIL